ncbi:MAG: hypothetical protein AAF572_10210 [Cyanobacteria bacterium P01_B01_bin.77]
MLKRLNQWLMVIMVTVSLASCWPSGSDAINVTPGGDMDKVKVTISIDDAHVEQIDQVTNQLKVAGLEVEQTLSTLGIVTGSVETEKMSALSKVTGVESVEADKSYQLAPPDSDVQ